MVFLAYFHRKSLRLESLSDILGMVIVHDEQGTFPL